MNFSAFLFQFPEACCSSLGVPFSEDLGTRGQRLGKVPAPWAAWFYVRGLFRGHTVFWLPPGGPEQPQAILALDLASLLFVRGQIKPGVSHLCKPTATCVPPSSADNSLLSLGLLAQSLPVAVAAAGTLLQE